MSAEKSENNMQDGGNDSTSKPDPETLHTTDPQEHMEGPISSLVKGASEELGDKNSGDKEETRNS